MDKHEVIKWFSRINAYAVSHTYDESIRILSAINKGLHPAFCISTSREYNPIYAQEIAFHYILNAIQHENADLQKGATNFLKRWSFILSSISPLDLLTNIQGLSKNQDYSNYLYIFLPAISNAISLMSDDEILHNFPLIQKLFHSIYITKQNEIPISIWQIIGKYSVEEEIIQLLESNPDVTFSSISSFLIQKNPKKFSNFLFKNASSDYLNGFIKNCNKNYDIDIDEAIRRVENECTKKSVADLNSTFLMFSNVLNFWQKEFNEDQKTKVKNILDKLNSFLEDDKISLNNKNSILLSLFEGAKKNLFDKDALKKLLLSTQFSDEFPQLKITCLKIAIVCMDKDSNNNEDYKRFFNFSPDEDQIYIQYLEVLGDNFSCLKEISNDFVIHLLWSIFHPLPIEEKIAISIVKFLLKLDPNEVLNSEVDSNLDYLFDCYMKISNSELIDLSIKLARLYKYSPSITKIDLLGKFNEKLIPLLTNVDPRLIKELVYSKFLEPKSRYSLFKVMQYKPNFYGEFAPLIPDIIYSLGRVLGIKYDINNSLWKCGIKKPEIIDEIIISLDEIKELFGNINGPIEESYFGSFLGAAFDTFSILSTNESNRSKIDLKDIAKMVVISSHFIQICPRQVLKLIANLQTFRTKVKDGNTLDGCFNESFRIIESAHIPMKFSIEVVFYSKACYGSYSETIKRFPKYINDALGKSRMVCDAFRNEIKQPLQPMNTFLSFVGIKEHEEWVDVCQSVIPPSEWKIRLNDEKIIENLKNLNEKTKEILKKRFDAIKNKPKPLSQIKESFLNRSSSFNLKTPIHISPGLNIHPKDNKFVKPGNYEISELDKILLNNQVQIDDNEFKSGTLFDVTSFLWHSKQDLPENIKPEDLENLALENHDNPMILIGFFSWSNSHNYKINLEKWKEAIKIQVFNDLWLFAIAMFASNIYCSFNEIPSEIVDVFQKCFTSFGYSKITKSILINGYYHLTGVKWLIVYYIIQIDLSYFNEYPLIVSELTNNMDIFKKYFDELDTNKSKEVNYYSFTGINNILFNPNENQMMLTSLIPTNRSFHSRVLSFKEISIIPTQIIIPKELLESIINCLQKATNVSYNYFAFFMNIKMTNEQFNRVHDIFFKDRESSDMNRKFLLPSLFVSETGQSSYLQDEAIRFYSNKPPSLTRAFFRSLLCCFAPPVNQDLIVKIESKLEEVFPDLCYCGFAKNGIRMWSNALPISKLRYGYVDNDIGSSLLNDMKIPSNESLCIYSLLFSLSDKDLAIAQPWATKGMIREEISRVLLETATSNESNAFFAFGAVSLICNYLGIDNSMVLIANKDLLERPNFLCALLAFQYLKVRAEKEKNSNVLDFIQVLQNPDTLILENEYRKKIFLEINSVDSISNLIHFSYSYTKK